MGRSSRRRRRHVPPDPHGATNVTVGQAVVNYVPAARRGLDHRRLPVAVQVRQRERPRALLEQPLALHGLVGRRAGEHPGRQLRPDYLGHGRDVERRPRRPFTNMIAQRGFQAELPPHPRATRCSRTSSRHEAVGVGPTGLPADLLPDRGPGRSSWRPGSRGRIAGGYPPISLPGSRHVRPCSPVPLPDAGGRRAHVVLLRRASWPVVDRAPREPQPAATGTRRLWLIDRRGRLYCTTAASIRKARPAALLRIREHVLLPVADTRG